MIGLPHVHHRVTDSTNARARELASRGAPHGTVVTAAEQTAGRGRQGRTWVAAPGDAILISVIIRESEAGLPMTPLAAAVAVAEACASLGAGDVAIKWPNDVWIGGRKVSGILVEGRPQEGWAVLGIGLNVGTREFPNELREIATSLALAGTDTTLDDAQRALLEELDRWLAEPAAAILDAWRERDALRGSRVRWEGGEGTAAGIDDGGSLLVETDDGELITLGAGEVHLQRD
jgi:BirA family biotin operon repressor/biotin-[acetyl-CoA-carboxylase] ligase